MGMFFDVLSAINNPNQEASIDKLSEVTGSLNEITSNTDLDPSAMEGVLSSLGGVLSSHLKDESQKDGNFLDGIMDKFTGGDDNPLTGGGNPLTGGIQSMISNQMEDQIIRAVAAKTGLNTSMLQGVVPRLLPAVMGLLRMGKTTPGAVGESGNPLLKSFLDGDGGADLGNVFKFANRFLNPGN